MEVDARKTRQERNNGWKDVGVGQSEISKAALESEKGVFFQCRACAFLVANVYAGRAHERLDRDTMAWEPGMGCCSRTCVRPRSHYRRKRFISTQQHRMQRLKEGDAVLIVPPAVRKELTRSILNQIGIDDAVAEVESMLKYA